MKYPTVYVDALFKRIESLSYLYNVHPYSKGIKNIRDMLDEIERIAKQEKGNEDFGIAGK